MIIDSKEEDLPYKSLDTSRQQIRLLCLKARSNRKRHTPRFKLRTFDINEAPPYQALSYTWGPPNPTKTIRLNGHHVEIRANLFAFLRTYRGGGYLWVDQICINQSNVDERNHQVNLMSQIYKDSDSVIVWLGSNDEKFLEAADEFAQKPKLNPLSIILKDKYFTTLWILQEILLAREVHVICRSVSGPVKIPWANMRAVATMTSVWLQQRGHPKRILSLLASQGTTRYKSLDWCVRRFSGYNCQDPRDKVYGLLGIVKQNQRLVVDYDKSVQEVFLDVLRTSYMCCRLEDQSFAEHRRNLEFLARRMGLESFDHRLAGLRDILVDTFSHAKPNRPNTSSPLIISNFGYSDANTVIKSETGPEGARRAKVKTAAWWYRSMAGETYFYVCCYCTKWYNCKCRFQSESLE